MSTARKLLRARRLVDGASAVSSTLHVLIAGTYTIEAIRPRAGRRWGAPIDVEVVDHGSATPAPLLMARARGSIVVAVDPH